ncbi:hypothetical protein ACJQWK_09934 [Exserohilum turcicum]
MLAALKHYNSACHALYCILSMAVAQREPTKSPTVALDPCQQITHRLPLDLAQCVMMHLAHQARTLFDG